MTEGGEPIVELGTQDAQGAFTGEFEFDYATDTGDALLRHVDSGAELRWSVSNSRWELNQPLDLGGENLTNVGAADVEQATNSQIGDGVNYINPLWLAESDLSYFIAGFESLDGYEQTTSGTGTVDFQAGGIRARGGDDAGSVGMVEKRKWENGQSPRFSFANKIVMSGSCFVQSVDEQDEGYLTVGQVHGGGEGFGFKLDSGNIQAVSHDGTTENTDNLSTGVTSQSRNRFLAVLDPGAGTVICTFDGESTTLSSNIPTGDFDRVLVARSVTASSSGDPFITIPQYAVVMEP